MSFKNVPAVKSGNNKLFIIMFVNKKNNISDYIQDIVLLNNKLKEHTVNHKLLFILHKCIGYQWHEWSEYEGIDILELLTCFPSVGTEFGFNINDIFYPFEKDNIYMDEIIK